MKLFVITLLLSLSSYVTAGHHEKGEISTNVAVVKAGYDAFNRGDMDAWREVQAKDSAWTIQVGLPYTGTYIGPAAIEEGIFGPIGRMWPDFKVEPIKFYESGSTVFVHVHMTAKGLDTESIHMVKIEDGKYASFQPFDDSAAMMSASLK
jgi:ketosteroid isomerase-like protein